MSQSEWAIRFFDQTYTILKKLTKPIFFEKFLSATMRRRDIGLKMLSREMMQNDVI